MATFKQKKKTQQNQAIGIGFVIILLIALAFYSYKQIFSGDESLTASRDIHTNCPIGGPSAYTAIVIDQSEGFPKNQVQQIRSMFGAWLAGRTEDILESSIDQDPTQFNKKAFDSDVLIQLFVMSKNQLNTDDGLKPVISLCRGPLPDDINSAQSIFINTKLLDKKLKELVERMDNELLELLVEHEQDTSPIIETISALSATEFSKDMNKPHYLIMVSDMVQYGGKGMYSHFPKYGNFTLDYDEWAKDHKKTFGTLRGAEWQVIYLNRKGDPDFAGAQTREHQIFWENYFRKSLYAGQGRFIVR